MDRRSALCLIGGAAAVPLLGGAAFAAAPPAPAFQMWRDPGCGCCLEWARRMEAAFNRRLPVIETGDMAAVKRARGIPDDLASCHTSLIHGYAIEGHVPPEDIKRLIASRNRAVAGLAVPGMPAGSPGMDVGHNQKQRYQVFAFARGGRRSVFATHG
jgi:hypothetical protein